MVRFGDYELPHMLDAQVQKSRIETERSVPGRAVAYRVDQAARGRTVKISGEIRADSMSAIAFWIELLRRLADDTKRLLDLEDGETAAFNAKLISPTYVVDVGAWVAGDYVVPYSVTLLEVA